MSALDGDVIVELDSSLDVEEIGKGTSHVGQVSESTRPVPPPIAAQSDDLDFLGVSFDLDLQGGDHQVPLTASKTDKRSSPLISRSSQPALVNSTRATSTVNGVITAATHNVINDQPQPLDDRRGRKRKRTTLNSEAVQTPTKSLRTDADSAVSNFTSPLSQKFSSSQLASPDLLASPKFVSQGTSFTTFSPPLQPAPQFPSLVRSF